MGVEPIITVLQTAALTIWLSCLVWFPIYQWTKKGIFFKMPFPICMILCLLKHISLFLILASNNFYKHFHNQRIVLWTLLASNYVVYFLSFLIFNRTWFFYTDKLLFVFLILFYCSVTAVQIWKQFFNKTNKILI